ncbi:MAG: thiol:disulfide interchange protein DsbA/DsbL [Chromatiales bacterium]
MNKLIAGGITASIVAAGLLAFSWLSTAEQQPAPESPAPAPAETVTLRAGENFRPVVPAQPTAAGGKIEVLEIFWYGCPHCNDLEPQLTEWLKTAKPADVEFRRLPGVFRQSWIPAAKAFYTAEALAVFDRMHPALFHAIHAEDKVFADDDAWAEFFAGLGVNKDDFKRTWDSLEVATKVRAAMTLGQSYGIEGVPALVVGGEYQTSSGMEGISDYQTLLKVVNALVVKVREEAQQQP